MWCLIKPSLLFSHMHTHTDVATADGCAWRRAPPTDAARHAVDQRVVGVTIDVPRTHCAARQTRYVSRCLTGHVTSTTGRITACSTARITINVRFMTAPATVTPRDTFPARIADDAIWTRTLHEHARCIVYGYTRGDVLCCRRFRSIPCTIHYATCAVPAAYRWTRAARTADARTTRAAPRSRFAHSTYTADLRAPPPLLPRSCTLLATPVRLPRRAT